MPFFHLSYYFIAICTQKLRPKHIMVCLVWLCRVKFTFALLLFPLVHFFVQQSKQTTSDVFLFLLYYLFCFSRGKIVQGYGCFLPFASHVVVFWTLLRGEKKNL